MAMRSPKFAIGEDVAFGFEVRVGSKVLEFYGFGKVSMVFSDPAQKHLTVYMVEVSHAFYDTAKTEIVVMEQHLRVLV